jgi:hypothetical protein
MTKKKNPVPSTRSRAQCSVERLDGWDKSTRPSGTPTGRWISGQAHYQLLPQHRLAPPAVGHALHPIHHRTLLEKHESS